MRKNLRCWAEVNLDALRANLAWIRHEAGARARVITVVKADAYGHGLRQIAALLMQSGTDMFGVANLEEARAIRSVGEGWPILMLGSALPHEAAALVRDGVRATVSSVDEAVRLSEEAKRQGRTARLHVKIDTGMGRLGVAVDAALGLIRRARELSNVKLEGICTHYAAAEDDAPFTRAQERLFAGVVNAARTEGIEFDWIHASNSGGFLFQKSGVCTAIRPGLVVYGIAPPSARRTRLKLAARLQPALAWKCRVSLVKAVPKGASLSYGRTFVAPGPMRIGVVTAGYGDGYMRAASHRAWVLIRGRRCRLLGRVTMDQMLADLSGLPEVESGEEVVLLGRQGEEEISAGRLAEWSGTVPWEVLTNITCRVPRLYTGSQAA